MNGARSSHAIRPLLLAGVTALVAAVALGHPAGASHDFTDVPERHAFHHQISWMSDQQVSQGYADGTFRPGADVTRQAIVAFLYRAEGEPDGPFEDPGFSDVPSGHQFYDPVAWAAELGITGGYPDGMFRPGATVTRQAAAAFLHRLEGEPDPPSGQSFSDVPPDHQFYDAIEWAADENITNGYPDGTFRPGADVTRQASAAFLYALRANDSGAEQMAVTFCDVGQADTTIVEVAATTIVVDAGHWQRSDVDDCLDGAGVTQIDVLALTHPDADHIGQAVDVLDTYEVTQVWRTSDANDTATYDEYDQRINSGDSSGEFDVVYPQAGSQLAVGPVTAHIVHPANSSDSDLSFRLSADVFGHGAATVLFTGDAEQDVESWMVSNHANWLNTQVYQVGHHGSSTSTTNALVDAVTPWLAVWSAGADNQYGHPHDGPIRRLVDAGAHVYGTATHGTVVATAGAAGWQVTSDTGDAPADGPEPEPECVDLNSASHERLQDIIHIGPERATAIIDGRPWGAVSELEQIDGIGPSRMQDIHDQGLACV